MFQLFTALKISSGFPREKKKKNKPIAFWQSCFRVLEKGLSLVVTVENQNSFTNLDLGEGERSISYQGIHLITQTQRGQNQGIVIKFCFILNKIYFLLNFYEVYKIKKMQQLEISQMKFPIYFRNKIFFPVLDPLFAPMTLCYVLSLETGSILSCYNC